MVDKNILNRLRISDNTPRRASNKWLYILTTCWDNILDNELCADVGSFF